MKVLTFYKYGGPEVLHVADIPVPAPKENQVLVRVKSLSLNDWDYGLMQGRPFINRTMAGNLFRPKNCIPGSDIAGVVEDLGKGVTRFRKGDRVFGDLSGTESWGGCAEYVCAGEEELALMGENLSFEEAAAIPQAGMLAVQAIIDQGKLQPGQSLLINGAGGGVGTFGLQIARAVGATYVAGVDRKDKLEWMKELGFDKALDYEKGEFLSDDRRYDLIVDTKTSFPFRRYRRLLNRGGRYVTVGGRTGLLMRLMAFKSLISLFHRREFRLVLLQANRDLGYLRDLCGRGDIRSVIDGPWPFEKIIDAFEYYGKGRQKGKVVISV